MQKRRKVLFPKDLVEKRYPWLLKLVENEIATALKTKQNEYVKIEVKPEEVPGLIRRFLELTLEAKELEADDKQVSDKLLAIWAKTRQTDLAEGIQVVEASSLYAYADDIAAILSDRDVLEVTDRVVNSDKFLALVERKPRLREKLRTITHADVVPKLTPPEEVKEALKEVAGRKGRQKAKAVASVR